MTEFLRIQLHDSASKPNRIVGGLLVLLVAGACGSAASADNGESTVTIEAREAWSGVFGDSDVSLTFDCRSPVDFAGRAVWSFAANGRILARSEVVLTIAAGGTSEVAVPLRVPPVKEGVIFEAQLTIHVVESGGADHATQLVKPIWIFPRDAFHDRSEWLAELNITLLDPQGETAKLFDAVEIPYKSASRTSAIEGLDEGILIVGEGVSLDSHRGLADALSQVAARGVPVLCLAPANGSLPLPGAREQDPAPNSVSLRRPDIITELDKRLDAAAWPPNDEVVVSALAVTSRRSQVVAEISDSDRAWPWLEVRYPGGGTLIVCGFGIVRHWDDGPTPRFLLARLVERLDKHGDKDGEK